MQGKVITDLFASFHEQSDNVKHQLTNLLDIVKDGRVPSPEAMSTLDICVTDLNNKYDTIFEVAQSTLSAEELPENGVSIDAIAEAISNSHSKFISEQLHFAKSILQKFINIKSLIDSYTAALSPYQTTATTLLQQLAEDTVEDLLTQTAAPELFLEAVSTDNFHSADGIALMEKVQQFYPEMGITVGLITKQYFLDETAPVEPTADVSNSTTASIEETSTLEPSVSEESVSSVIEAVVEHDVTESTDENSPFGNDMFANEGVSETYPVLNKVRSGTPSVSSFKKEIVKIGRNYPEIRTIFPLLTNLGVLTKFQIRMLGMCMDCLKSGKEATECVHAAVDYLTEKGLLAHFIAGKGTDLYCLSGYSCTCMHKESIRHDKRIFDISIGSVKFSGNSEVPSEEALRFYLFNEVLTQYLCVLKKKLSRSQFEKVKGSIQWRNNHYQVLYSDNGVLSNAYLIALICSDDTAEAPEIDATSIDAKCIIIGKFEAERKIVFNENCEKVIVVDGVNIYHCNPREDLLTQVEDALCKKEIDCVEHEETEEISDIMVTEDTVSSVAPDEELTPISVTQIPPTVESAIVEPMSESAMSADVTVDDSPLEHTEDSSIVQYDELCTDYIDSTPIAGIVNTPEASTTANSSQTIITVDRLLIHNGVPTDEEFSAVIHELLTKETKENQLTKTIVNALLLARGAGLATNRPGSKRLSAQLRLATNLLRDECNYSSEFLGNTFANSEIDVPALTLAAYMYALLTPAVTYDYGLKAQTEQYLSDFDIYFEELTAFKALFNKLLSVRSVKASGFTPAVIALLGNEAESERFIKTLRREAKVHLTVNTPKTRMKALPVMYGSEFGVGSNLYNCMQVIADGKTDSESLEWVEAVLGDFCEITDGEYALNEDKIEHRLNEAWDYANSKSKFRLEYDARDQALKQYRQRLTVMVKWVDHIHNSSGNIQDIDRLKVLRKEILNLITDIRKDMSWKSVKDANALTWLLVHMENYLMDNVSNIDIFSDLLYTGVFSLSLDGIPEIDTSLGNLKYYEVWRNALRHIVTPRRTIEDITSEILGETLDAEHGLKDNLRQLLLLGLFNASDDEVFKVSDEQAKEAEVSANERTDRFKDNLELAYTYYQINETEKENLVAIVNQYKASFYEIRDFASWRRFLEALELQIREFAAGRKKSLCSRLDGLLAKDCDSTLLKEANRLLEEDSNFAVTEEYLNRYESGEHELDNAILFDNDYFIDFLSPSVFDSLYRECMRFAGDNLKRFGWNYIEKKLPKEWTARLRDDSKTLVSHWPVRKDTSTSVQIQGLLKGLGIDAINATKVTGRKEEMWQVSVKPTARSLADYLHPIASFGTQMKSPLQIIFLFGSYTPRQLVDTVTSMNLGTMSLVFIDRPIDTGGRRYIGEIFHTQKTGQNPFLLIDQVLFLYLAMHQETERLPALLKCTLPYATYQPFVRDGGSTADEMFCGRTLELATIIDPNGACVVYGGRQLGKTALLERAESRCSKPENKAFAVYSTIIRQRDESEVVYTLLADIQRKTDGKIKLKPCKTIKDMCAQLSSMFMSGQIVSMHLLIDEVDDFLGSVSSDAYNPIQPMVDLKRETKNNFKFVIAGLHNVCRAKNATKGNGVFGQLGTPLCIKPLSPTDALQLLSKPLRYLGFRIDRYPHLETILTNTNYYPGILQFFGYILVETLTGQYSKYYRAADGNPPFTLQNEQLGAVMNSADLNKSIKDKFRWSLELDPRYFMIARCITLLYHYYEEDRASGSWRGFSVDDIMGIADEYIIHCLENVSKSEYIVLMDEMVEMGILGKPDENINTYRLRRNSFVDIIGESFDIVEADIKTNNTEV